MLELHVGCNGQRRFVERIDDVVDRAIVLGERRRVADRAGAREIAAGGENQRVGRVDRPGGGSGNPVVAVGVVAVVERDAQRDGTDGVVGLHAAAHGGFLVPEQAALDVEVLEIEGVFGADQGRQLAGFDREAVGGLEFDECLWNGAEEVAQRVLGIGQMAVGGA